MFTLSFNGLPDEVTDYAFDQFDDRLQGPERGEAEAAVYADESVETEYDAQTVTVHDTVMTRVLRDAMAEKLRDIEREVERGERDDHTVEDVRQYRRRMDAIFSGRDLGTANASGMRDADAIEAKLTEIRNRDHSYMNSGKRDALEWVLEQLDDDL